jgi:hypothetical protein
LSLQQRVEARPKERQECKAEEEIERTIANVEPVDYVLGSEDTAVTAKYTHWTRAPEG